MSDAVADEELEKAPAPREPDSHLRSILKAFSWRIVATLTTAAIAYVVTGEASTALVIGGIEFFLKMFIYYVHERAWQLVPRL